MSQPSIHGLLYLYVDIGVHDLSNEKADIDGPPEKKVRSSPTKAALKTTNDEIRRKIKVLQQKIRHQKKKIKTQTELIDDLKERTISRPIAFLKVLAIYFRHSIVFPL